MDAALELKPDLITVSAGGNDIIRPGTDPDDIASRFEAMVERLRSDGATVVMFNGPDVGMTPVLGRVRGKVAIYNENLRAVAQRHDAIVADMWALRELRDPRMWAPDRLHFSPIGHHRIAIMVLDALNVEHDLVPDAPEPLPRVPWRQARVEDIGWAREYFVPWVLRRIRHRVVRRRRRAEAAWLLAPRQGDRARRRLRRGRTRPAARAVERVAGREPDLVEVLDDDAVRREQSDLGVLDLELAGSTRARSRARERGAVAACSGTGGARPGS